MAIGYNPKIVTNGLVSHLDAANRKSYTGSGTTWFNLAGSTHATLSGGPTYNTTNLGSFSFDGIDDYVDTNVTTTTSNFSVSVWYTRTTNSFWAPIWANEVFNNNTGCMLFYSGTALLNLRVGNGSFSVGFANNTVPVLYTVTLTGAGLASIYINSNLSSQTSVTLPSSIEKTIKLSTRHSNDGTGFIDTRTSTINSFSYYNRVLSLNEVRQNFEATRGRYGV